ncbi:hypothetical protein [Azospirillum thiophilum]|uniref:hypothetical protein n=1 Tax=Azospirillum thiophilum TaxID=528244 RepID=UPI000696889B|nr:hypothetical protein [Azospirillum thiophilum]
MIGASVLVGGCNAQNAKEAGGAFGTVLGVVVGAAIGGNSDMGAAGGALFGGVAGFIAGSLVGQIIDDVDRAKQQEATQAALNDGTTMHWASPKNSGVYGRTEIVSTRTVPIGSAATAGTQTVKMPISETPYHGPVVYCDPQNGKPYRLEAPRCPGNGGVVEISAARYAAMVPDAMPSIRKAETEKPTRKEKVQTASLPSDMPLKPAPASQPLAVAPMETVCRIAREVVWIEGKEQVDQVEYCRAPGASAWQKKAA